MALKTLQCHIYKGENHQQHIINEYNIMRDLRLLWDSVNGINAVTLMRHDNTSNSGRYAGMFVVQESQRNKIRQFIYQSVNYQNSKMFQNEFDAARFITKSIFGFGDEEAFSAIG
jgi:hypothetical protein